MKPAHIIVGIIFAFFTLLAILIFVGILPPFSIFSVFYSLGRNAMASLIFA